MLYKASVVCVSQCVAILFSVALFPGLPFPLTIFGRQKRKREVGEEGPGTRLILWALIIVHKSKQFLRKLLVHAKFCVLYLILNQYTYSIPSLFDSVCCSRVLKA